MASSDLNVTMVLRGDASSAAAALKAVATGASGAKGALDKLGNSGGDLGPKIVPPLTPVPPLLDGVAQKSGSAAAGVANLTAQFNDIGVMLASGQNPLQLALQQGTQITQVFAGMRAEGQSLRGAMIGAFTGMLNPISLVTIGSIAAAGVMTQWFASSTAGARSLTDTLDDMAKKLDELKAITEAYSADGIQSMVDKYGEVNAALLTMLERQREFAINAAMADANAALEAMSAQYGDIFSAIDQTGRTVQAAQLLAQNELGMTREQAIALKQALEEASAAGTFAGKADALARVQVMLESSALAGTAFSSEILAAEDTLRQLAAAAPDANWMAAAISGVTALTGSIWDAVSANLALAKSDAKIRGEDRRKDMVYSGRGIDPRQFIAGSPNTFNKEFFADPDAKQPGRGAGGGAKAANALQQLMARQQAELDILRATDPVQKEMVRNREALAGATVAERATIEGLIAQRIAEQAQMQALQQGWDMIGQSAYQALDQIIVQGKSARDVVANLAGSLASAALQSAILGKGPLSGFFGTAGTGGLLGMIFPALRKADGGRIAGPGTGRSDSIAAWLSNGEYVVNAAATARNLPLLEAINSNRAPRFADGGLVAGPPIRATGGGVGTAGAAAEQIVVVLQLSDDLDARIEAASSRVAVRAVRAGVRQYDKAMPARVSQISQDPRAR